MNESRLQITFTVDFENINRAMSAVMKAVDGLVTSPTIEARIVEPEPESARDGD